MIRIIQLLTFAAIPLATVHLIWTPALSILQQALTLN